MTWEPITDAGIRTLIRTAEGKMSPDQFRIWKLIEITPKKWPLSPWGDLGGGFWVVARLGRTVVWYNDIEEGFNVSAITEKEEIAEYWCNQDELQCSIREVLKMLAQEPLAPVLGPPQEHAVS